MASGAFERGDSGQITMRDSPLERALLEKSLLKISTQRDKNIGITGITLACVIR